jgi:hypothetical protein
MGEDRANGKQDPAKPPGAPGAAPQEPAKKEAGGGARDIKLGSYPVEAPPKSESGARDIKLGSYPVEAPPSEESGTRDIKLGYPAEVPPKK